MAWNPSDYIEGSSLNGIPFFVRADTATVGRRQHIYEVVGGESARFNDLGKIAFRDQMDFFVIGENVAIERDNLMREANKEGPHVLIHPHYGQIDIIFETPLQASHSETESRMVTMSATVVQVVDDDFIPIQDTEVSVEVAADALASAMIKSPPIKGTNDPNFLDKLRDLSDNLARVQGRVSSQLHKIDEVGNAIDDFNDGIEGLLQAPDQLIAKIVGVQRSILRLVDTVVEAVDPAERLQDNIARAQLLTSVTGESYDLGADDQTLPPPATEAEQDRQANLIALDVSNNLLRISESARQASRVSLDSAGRALAMQDVYIDTLDRMVEADIELPEDVERAIYELRATLSNHLRKVAQNLSLTTDHIPSATIPMVLIAMNLFGDAREADQLAIRNNVERPNFTPEGVALEIARGGV